MPIDVKYAYRAFYFEMFEKEVNLMANRDIGNRETKKKKKSDAAAPLQSAVRAAVSQPEVVKKHKKAHEPES